MTQDPKQFSALIGFAFVAAWIAFNFGYAVLCLVGAAVFYALAALARGELDLAAVQERVRGGSAGAPAPPPRPAAPPPVPRSRAPRVR